MEGSLDLRATCYAESTKAFSLFRLRYLLPARKALSPSRLWERLDEVLPDRHVESHSADGHSVAGPEVLAQLQLGHSNSLRNLASFHHYGPPAVYGASSGHAAYFHPSQSQTMEFLLTPKTMHANCGTNMSADVERRAKSPPAWTRRESMFHFRTPA